VTLSPALNPSRFAGLRVYLIAAVILYTLGAGGAAAPAAVINATVAGFLAAHAGGQVQLIVQTKAAPAPVERDVRAAGGTIASEFGAINGFTASVGWEEANRINHDPRVLRVNLNAAIRLLGGAVSSGNLANRYEQISAIPAAWNHGYDGSEVQVAVIDSGVYPHDDLTQRSAYVPANGGNRLLGLYTNPNATDAGDEYGHGTHVAGIIAGNGSDSQGQYIGVAPNSLIVSVKVTDNAGNASEGDVITGLDWVYQANQHGMHIRLINLSLSSTVAQSYQQSALDAMAEKLWNSGVTVVASAGAGSGSVLYAPGNDPYVITVGSVEDNYQASVSGLSMASWSPYGNTQDGYAKPELVADGSHVTSLLAPGSTLAQQHPANVVGSSYFKMGGTSMAAPQVVGLVALMLQANPGMTNNQIKGTLVNHAKGFGTVLYTSLLGTPGGLMSQTAVGNNDATANAGLSFSQSYSPSQNAILAGGTWWTDASWPNASWNSTAWNSTAWNSTAWNSTAWNSTAWNSTAWNSTAWNSTAWNSTAWNSTAWNSTAWNSTAWNDVNFQ
jgi:serine protease AprX